MKQTKRKFTAAFKAQVVLEALKERETLSELSNRFEVHANMISKWKQEFIARSAQVFETKPVENTDTEEKARLYAKIGELEMEKDFLKKSLKRIGL